MSHDAALDDLAVRRTSVYAALVPLTPARLGRRSRSSVLTGVVDDLTDVVEAQVRVTVPLISSALAGAGRRPAHRVVRPRGRAGARRPAGRGRRRPAGSPGCSSRARATSCSSRAPRCCGSATSWPARPPSCRRSAATDTAAGWLADAHDTLRRAVRRQSRGRALVAAALLVATAVATLRRRAARRPGRHRRPGRGTPGRRPGRRRRRAGARWSTRCATSPEPRAARCASTRCSTRSRR